MTAYYGVGNPYTKEIVDARDSFYENNKHRIIAGINPEYRKYRRLVEAVEKATRLIGSESSKSKRIINLIESII